MVLSWLYMAFFFFFCIQPVCWMQCQVSPFIHKDSGWRNSYPSIWPGHCILTNRNLRSFLMSIQQNSVNQLLSNRDGYTLIEIQTLNFDSSMPSFRLCMLHMCVLRLCVFCVLWWRSLCIVWGLRLCISTLTFVISDCAKQSLHALDEYSDCSQAVSPVFIMCP